MANETWGLRLLQPSVSSSVDENESGDVIPMGFWGLVGAIQAFDPDRDVPFEIFCRPRIHASFFYELKSLNWTPHLIRDRSRQLERSRQILETQLGHIPSDDELASIFDIDGREFYRMQKGFCENWPSASGIMKERLKNLNGVVG